MFYFYFSRFFSLWLPIRVWDSLLFFISFFTLWADKTSDTRAELEKLTVQRAQHRKSIYIWLDLNSHWLHDVSIICRLAHDWFTALHQHSLAVVGSRVGGEYICSMSCQSNSQRSAAILDESLTKNSVCCIFCLHLKMNSVFWTEWINWTFENEREHVGVWCPAETHRLYWWVGETQVCLFVCLFVCNLPDVVLNLSVLTLYDEPHLVS